MTDQLPIIRCVECGKVMSSHGYTTTLVGSGNSGCPLGRSHDDNCQKHDMRCGNGHHRMVSLRRTCECGWKGKLTCLCHEGEKLEANVHPTMADLSPSEGL